MPEGIARARLLPLLAVLFTVILGTSGRAQNPNSRFPFAAGGGYASENPTPELAGYVHFAFSAMNDKSGSSNGRGYGRLSFAVDGQSDQGNVICFSPDSPTTARFTISVAKGPDRFLLVEVMDNGSLPDMLGYSREHDYPDCTVNHPTFLGPVYYGNIVVSDGSQ
jgi:hypothetical protein